MSAKKTGSPATRRARGRKSDIGSQPASPADESLLLNPPEVLAADLSELAQTKPVPPQNIQGSFDQCDISFIAGWVADLADLQPRRFAVYADGELLVEAVADEFRPDVAQAGVGNGCHSFRLPPPTSLADGQEHLIEVRDLETGIVIAGSPRHFQTLARHAHGDEIENTAGADENLADQDILPPPVPTQIVFDVMVGTTASGWAVVPEQGARCLKLCMGGKALGKVKLDQPRPDVQQALGLDTDQMGYQLMLGGVLHFSALSNGLEQAQLEQVVPGHPGALIDMASFYQEGFTFSPLRALARVGDLYQVGQFSHASCSPTGKFSILLDTQDSVDKNRIGIHFFQQGPSENLRLVGHFDLALQGQLVKLDFDLLSSQHPVLMILTDQERQILLTDCIPCPDLFSDTNAHLVEYHSWLCNAQSAFSVATKLARNLLDYHLAAKLQQDETTEFMALQQSTEVLLFIRGDFDAFAGFDAAYFQHVSKRVSLLGRDGMVITPDSEHPLRVGEFLANTTASQFILCELGSSLRPDFWATLYNRRTFLDQSPLVYWDSIWLEGSSRPYMVRNQMLCHSHFSTQKLAPINSLMVSRELLLEAAVQEPDRFRSGLLRPENLFSFVDRGSCLHLAVVMDTCRLPLLPSVLQNMMEEQAVLPERMLAENPALGLVPVAGGISVIINYRNSTEATIRCLISIQLQQHTGPLEVILVNNGSTAAHCVQTREAAVRMFGEDALQFVDYDGRFNHSYQCNLAASLARYDILFMISNDALLINQDVLARAMRVVQVPWVATCGFRIVQKEKDNDDQLKLNSLGLKLAAGKYLFMGASPLVSNVPPTFAQDYTVGVAGNTFAAVVLRKAVYEEMEGLDEIAFPTDYNDVDFCMRALDLGYQHVALGDLLVSHSGRGSREMNLDLPIHPKIMERLPDLAVLQSQFMLQMLN